MCSNFFEYVDKKVMGKKLLLYVFKKLKIAKKNWEAKLATLDGTCTQFFSSLSEIQNITQHQ